MSRFSPWPQTWQLERIRAQIDRPFLALYCDGQKPTIVRDVFTETGTVLIDCGELGGGILIAEQVLMIMDVAGIG